ncbi:acyl-CoA dehydrogenase NM domain-like protein [Schizopora paradoxa]|uniref:Acyl-CoA dehydrogenase NM domain-like protein n=1 Tax=Schizopora paradoxa TaxID=27342 RepID=A0A0H2RQ79_9AGAM|nr:acyl-CoA dehydrogenase NM domain-like protein [Schizopora paradoxa]
MPEEPMPEFGIVAPIRESCRDCRAGTERNEDAIVRSFALTLALAVVSSLRRGDLVCDCRQAPSGSSPGGMHYAMQSSRALGRSINLSCRSDMVVTIGMGWDGGCEHRIEQLTTRAPKRTVDVQTQCAFVPRSLDCRRESGKSWKGERFLLFRCVGLDDFSSLFVVVVVARRCCFLLLGGLYLSCRPRRHPSSCNNFNNNFDSTFDFDLDSVFMMSPHDLSHISSQCAQLAQSDLFALPHRSTSLRDRVELTYKRARAIAKVYDLSAHDVTALTDKFWAMHWDNIAALDVAAFSILTIQYNLVAGALAPHAATRPELRPLLKQILDFSVSGQFLLTELAHGLDAPNLETTATLLPSGEFDLHTPRLEACKFMPPAAPFGGMPRVGLVFARLVVEGENRGIRPFIVVLGDGKSMSKGITTRLMPKRAGAKPVDHAITRFSHVRLPYSALLGSLQKPLDDRANFLSCISRVAIGSLAVSLLALPALSISTFIAARYSLRRTVTAPGGEQVPIWSFRTQQLPILHALAQLAVMRAHAGEAVRMVSEGLRGERSEQREIGVDGKGKEGDCRDPRVRHAVGACLKAAFMQHGQGSLLGLMERVGAQGLFEENQIIAIQLESRGVCIAEGDTLVLSIRLASELLLGRYALPKPRYPHCLLAQHEAGLFAECHSLLSSISAGGSGGESNHRGDAFNRLILPQARPLVEAIGHRMAYEAALDAGVDAPLLALYEAGVVRLDGAWYAEHIKTQDGLPLGHLAQITMEERAATACAPFIERYLSQTGAEAYASATPILSREGWGAFMAGLELCEGEATLSVLPGAPQHCPSSSSAELSSSSSGHENTDGNENANEGNGRGAGGGGSRPFLEQQTQQSTAMLSATARL